jgi:hypothetical protein
MTKTPRRSCGRLSWPSKERCDLAWREAMFGRHGSSPPRRVRLRSYETRWSGGNSDRWNQKSHRGCACEERRVLCYMPFHTSVAGIDDPRRLKDRIYSSFFQLCVLLGRQLQKHTPRLFGEETTRTSLHHCIDGFHLIQFLLI